jgi:hypothetical protein
MHRRPFPSMLTRSGAAALLGAGILLGSAGGAAASSGSLPAGCAAVDTTTARCTYTYTGAEQSFVVPTGVTSVDVRAVGARGGAGPNDDGTINQAAEATGTLSVTPGNTLVLAVGGRGGDSTRATAPAQVVPGGAPGWNGGAWGGDAVYTSDPHDSGAGGGGASDVRTVSRDAAGTLESRVLVAAGSGGGAYIREGGPGDLNGWTHVGASAAEAGQPTRAGRAGTLWGWRRSACRGG